MDMNNIYSAFGRIAFYVMLPLIRFQIHSTKRSYVVIMCDEELLFVKGWLSRQKLALPGGGKHKNETSIDAAIRETHEETKIKLDKKGLNFVSEGVWNTDRLGFNYEIFVCRINAKPSVLIRKGEIIEYAWIDRNNLPEKDVPQEMQEALGIIKSKSL
jgi:8-oxo-dGTP pyrophosphatase MutT (NUDIX family)